MALYMHVVCAASSHLILPIENSVDANVAQVKETV